MRLFRNVSCTLAILLTACSGGGGGGQSSGGGEGDTDQVGTTDPAVTGYPTMDVGAASVYASRSEFRAVDLSTSEENSLRQQLGLDPLCSGSTSPNCRSASTYGLQNIHFAHTATLTNDKNVTGDGTLIAIVDTGYRTSHRELAGKTIDAFLGQTASLPIDAHGTAVAAIAAGKVDGQSILGVAPDAALHLTAWSNVSSQNMLAHLTDASLEAAANGAAAQNNSWGWAKEIAASEEMAAFQSSGAGSYASYLTGRLGATASQWNSLFSAYDTFQQSGVIVYSNSNTAELIDADAWAALPLFVPSLREAWITVGNALFAIDGSTGAILDAELISAPCGSAAAFCLTTDGSVYAPTDQNDSTYEVWTGTSFSAPQISGQIALLSQAFPNLSPAEWTTRLLATAQNDWPSFQDSIAGEVVLAAGVAHSYSSVYGHGIPDMHAALSPVGGLSVTSGANVFTADRSSADTVATSAPLVGDSVARAIAGREIMLVDALGTDFYVKGADLGGLDLRAAFAARGNVSMHMSRGAEQLELAFSESATLAPASDSLRDAAAAKLIFSHNYENRDAQSRFSGLLALGDRSFLQFGGNLAESRDGDAMSFSLSHLKSHDHFTAEYILSMGHSLDRFFGAAGSGPFLDADHTSHFSAGASVNVPLADGWSLTGFAELGGAHVMTRASALMEDVPLAYASGGIVINRRGILTGRDMLSLHGGVRPTTIAGMARLSLPVSRDREGNIGYQTIDVKLADASIPLRAGLSYKNTTARDFDLVLNANADFDSRDPGDVQASLSVGLAKRF